MGEYELECIDALTWKWQWTSDLHNRWGKCQSATQIEVPRKGLILMGSLGLMSSNTGKYYPPLLTFLRMHIIDLSFPKIIFVGGTWRMGHYRSLIMAEVCILGKTTCREAN